MAAKDNKEVKKYLTEIKELPNYEEEDRAQSQAEKNEGDATKSTSIPQDSPSTAEPTADKDIKKQPESQTLEIKENTDDNNISDILKPSPNKEVRRIAGIPFTTRDIILNVINLLTVVLLLVILARLDDKAAELKEIKNENLRLSENYNYNVEQVNENVEQANELESLFTTDTGVIDFVSAVENLNESGAIRNVSFSSPDPVKDKSGSFGRPIIINLRGSWDQIDLAIDNIHSLPYVFRPVKIDIERVDDGGESGELNVSYGGLLYIKNPNTQDEQN